MARMDPFSLTVLSVIGVSLVSLIGVFAFALNHELLKKSLIPLVALAAGALLGDALIHLIPESLEAIGDEALFGVAVLGGISLFFILERVFRWHHAHHAHEDEHEGHERYEKDASHSHVAPLVLVADGIHNIVDGAVIAASYLVSPALGVATTIAVFLHEIPQEIADYALLVHAGYSRTKALLWNFASGLTALLGALVVLYVGSEIDQFAAYASAVTAGAFVYLAAADLIPDLNRSTRMKDSAVILVSFGIGIALMLALTLLETH